MFQNKSRQQYSHSNRKQSYSRNGNNFKNRTYGNKSEDSPQAFVPSTIVVNGQVHTQSLPEQNVFNPTNFTLRTSHSPSIPSIPSIPSAIVVKFPGNTMGSTEERSVFTTNNHVNSTNKEKTFSKPNAHFQVPDSSPSNSTHFTTSTPSAPPLSPNEEISNSSQINQQLSTESTPIPSAPPMETSPTTQDSSKRFFNMNEEAPPRYSPQYSLSNSSKIRSDKEDQKTNRSRSHSRDSSRSRSSSSSYESHGKRKFRENEIPEPFPVSKSNQSQRPRYDNSRNSNNFRIEQKRSNEPISASKHFNERSSYSPSRPSSPPPPPTEINNSNSIHNNRSAQRRSPTRDPRLQNRPPITKENSRVPQKLPHPLEYFLKEFSMNPLRALELFFQYKKNSSLCTACNPRSTRECTYRLCMVCCIKLGLNCKKHSSFALSPFSMVNAPSLDNDRLVDDDTAGKVAAWYQSYVDPSLVVRFSKIIQIKANRQYPNIHLEFEDIYSQLPNSQGYKGTIILFRSNSPIPCVHWKSGEFELNAIPRQFRISPFDGYLFAVLYQICSVEDLVNRAKSRCDLLGRIKLPASIPLLCPISGTRIKIPARSVECPHPQCFDLMSYLNHNRILCTAISCQLCEWNCAVCKRYMPFTSIGVDIKILNVLQSEQNKDTLWIEDMDDDKITKFSILDFEELLTRNIKHISKEQSWLEIKKWCFGNDEVEVGRIAISIKCPLTLKPIKLPCRTDKCSHIQCFDLSGYVDYLRQLRIIKDETKWTCPICDCNTTSANLYIDDFILSIISECHADQERVEIRKDGTWEVALATVPVAKSNNNQVVDLTLSDDDEDVHEVSSRTSTNFTFPPPPPVMRNTVPSLWNSSSSRWSNISSWNSRPVITSGWGSSANESPASLLNQRLNTEKQLQVMEDQVRQLEEREKNESPSQQSNNVGVQQQLERMQLELQQLRRENERLKDRTRCVVCLDRDIGGMLLPCYHQCTCWTCALQVKNCPVCRQIILNRQRVFFG